MWEGQLFVLLLRISIDFYRWMRRREYLDSLTQEERERVLAEEAASKAQDQPKPQRSPDEARC